MARIDGRVASGQQTRVQGGTAYVCADMKHDMATHTQVGSQTARHLRTRRRQTGVCLTTGVPCQPATTSCSRCETPDPPLSRRP
eukprot:40333-Eustigmatos_ZCMA.PRE.1